MKLSKTFEKSDAEMWQELNIKFLFIAQVNIGGHGQSGIYSTVFYI